MIDPAHGPDIGSDEVLARYVLQSSHIRSNQTVKPNAFVPHPYEDLSVTRHLMATEDEIWSAGETVAMQTEKTLYGRADVIASEYLARRLILRPDALPENPNHANVSGWPAEKPMQKIVALEIAAV